MHTHIHTQVPDCTLASLRALYGMVTTVPPQLTPLLARATDAFDTTVAVDSAADLPISSFTSECSIFVVYRARAFDTPVAVDGTADSPLSAFTSECGTCWHCHVYAAYTISYNMPDGVEGTVVVAAVSRVLSQIFGMDCLNDSETSDAGSALRVSLGPRIAVPRCPLQAHTHFSCMMQISASLHYSSAQQLHMHVPRVLAFQELHVPVPFCPFMCSCPFTEGQPGSHTVSRTTSGHSGTTRGSSHKVQAGLIQRGKRLLTGAWTVFGALGCHLPYPTLSRGLCFPSQLPAVRREHPGWLGCAGSAAAQHAPLSPMPTMSAAYFSTYHPIITNCSRRCAFHSPLCQQAWASRVAWDVLDLLQCSMHPCHPCLGKSATSFSTHHPIITYR
eukprot:1159597-Pelagomonas_calceolata.AAC.20